MIRFKDLFENEQSKTPTKILPALVSQHMKDHGLEHVESIKNTDGGLDRHVFEGPRMRQPQLNALGKTLAKRGFVHSSYPGFKGNVNTYHGPDDAEMNSPYHYVQVDHTKDRTKMTYVAPTQDRLETSRRSYEHGDAKVEGRNEGSMHYRTARGPSRESVEGAFDHYLAAHGRDRESNSKKGGGAIYGNETQQLSDGTFTKTWNHFRSDT